MADVCTMVFETANPHELRPTSLFVEEVIRTVAEISPFDYAVEDKDFETEWDIRDRVYRAVVRNVPRAARDILVRDHRLKPMADGILRLPDRMNWARRYPDLFSSIYLGAEMRAALARRKAA